MAMPVDTLEVALSKNDFSRAYFLLKTQPDQTVWIGTAEAALKTTTGYLANDRLDKETRAVLTLTTVELARQIVLNTQNVYPPYLIKQAMQSLLKIHKDNNQNHSNAIDALYEIYKTKKAPGFFILKSQKELATDLLKKISARSYNMKDDKQLHDAIATGDVKKVENTLKNLLINDNLRAFTTKIHSNQTGSYYNPIELAASEGKWDIVKLIAASKKSLGADILGYGNALLTAAKANQTDAVKFLLNAGAKIEWDGKSGHSALHWAVEHKNLEMVNLLLATHSNSLSNYILPSRSSSAMGLLFSTIANNQWEIALALSKHISYDYNNPSLAVPINNAIVSNQSELAINLIRAHLNSKQISEKYINDKAGIHKITVLDNDSSIIVSDMLSLAARSSQWETVKQLLSSFSFDKRQMGNEDFIETIMHAANGQQLEIFDKLIKLNGGNADKNLNNLLHNLLAVNSTKMNTYASDIINFCQSHPSSYQIDIKSLSYEAIKNKYSIDRIQIFDKSAENLTYPDYLKEKYFTANSELRNIIFKQLNEMATQKTIEGSHARVALATIYRAKRAPGFHLFKSQKDKALELYENIRNHDQSDKNHFNPTLKAEGTVDPASKTIWLNTAFSALINPKNTPFNQGQAQNYIASEMRIGNVQAMVFQAIIWNDKSLLNKARKLNAGETHDALKAANSIIKNIETRAMAESKAIVAADKMQISIEKAGISPEADIVTSLPANSPLFEVSANYPPIYTKPLNELPQTEPSAPVDLPPQFADPILPPQSAPSAPIDLPQAYFEPLNELPMGTEPVAPQTIEENEQMVSYPTIETPLFSEPLPTVNLYPTTSYGSVMTSLETSDYNPTPSAPFIEDSEENEIEEVTSLSDNKPVSANLVETSRLELLMKDLQQAVDAVNTAKNFAAGAARAKEIALNSPNPNKQYNFLAEKNKINAGFELNVSLDKYSKAIDTLRSCIDSVQNAIPAAVKLSEQQQKKYDEAVKQHDSFIEDYNKYYSEAKTEKAAQQDKTTTPRLALKG